MSDSDTNSSAWYQSETFWATFYDLMFNSSRFEEAADEVAAIRQLTGVEAGAVLDLACGPGRHCVPFAEAGHKVTALDLDAKLLQAAREYANQRSQAVRFLHQDMRDLDLEAEFDLAVCMWTSFGYFDNPQDDLTVLASVFEALKHGGWFVLDVVGKEYLLRHLQPVHATEFDDGRLLVERPVLTDDLCSLHNEWLLIDGDHVERAEWSHSIYTARELLDRMIAVGFRNLRVMSTLDGDDYDQDSERLIVAAQRLDN